jgi:hypothetical protein
VLEELGSAMQVIKTTMVNPHTPMLGPMTLLTKMKGLLFVF